LVFSVTLRQHAQTVETRKAPPRSITASVLLVVAGCIVAGIGDFSFDIRGCGSAFARSNRHAACVIAAGLIMQLQRDPFDTRLRG
jgi:hypothetical protein